MFHWILVGPQALKSVLPVEDSFSIKEMHTFSHIIAHQSLSETFNTSLWRKKQSQLLSTTLPLRFWEWIRLVIRFCDKVCLFCVMERNVLKMTFHHYVKKNLFHISTNTPHFCGILVGQRAQRSISLSQVIASAISAIIFFYYTPWRSSTALLVEPSLFSSLHRSKSVATCSPIFCQLFPLDFIATVK